VSVAVARGQHRTVALLAAGVPNLEVDVMILDFFSMKKLSEMSGFGQS
jgi:hypothetical protein